MATVEKLWIKPAKGLPMRAVTELHLREGHGIDDNADAGGRRQVTIISLERWHEACTRLSCDLDPVLRRANVLVSGLHLVDSRDRTLRLGDATVRIGGENRPCRLMDDFHPGLQDALDASWGGGVHARVTETGLVRVGAVASWLGEGG